ncbi:hypothetical protein [Lutimaribacter saemankumensis]|nr:hypothetical protein [Lutimaribacter saemankumensis]
MKRVFFPMIFAPLLAACSLLPGRDAAEFPPAPPGEGQLRPVARPDSGAARVPPAGARTAEALDTTTAEERAAAASPAAGGARDLGATIATLGDPARPGFWLETPLVRSPAKGRVEYDGKSAQVDLIPIDGAATAGSRLSLAAMRLIGAPLAGLPEIRVFTDG